MEGRVGQLVGKIEARPEGEKPKARMAIPPADAYYEAPPPKLDMARRLGWLRTLFRITKTVCASGDLEHTLMCGPYVAEAGTL